MDKNMLRKKDNVLTSVGDAGGFEFGPQEPLTVRLRGLIRNYPKGTGILKEFIQNADDAGADCVKVVMDWRTHPSERLPNPKMKTLMGPALLVYNNEVFTERDVQNIQEIGEGGDKTEDVSKTGRFGLGFNSVYHLTDYPHFLTGDRIFFVDPHHNVVPGANANFPGRGWNLSDQTWEDFFDLLRAFQIFGLREMQEYFDGTVFRLPLRTEEHLDQSRISDEPFTRDDFNDILHQLIETGAELLLFLKHVETISVGEITSTDGSIHWLLNISTENADVVRKSRDLINDWIVDSPHDLLEKLKGEELPVVSYKHVIDVHSNEHHDRSVWRVASGLFVDHVGLILEIMEEMFNIKEKAIPWTGAAAKLHVGEAKNLDGKLYCFLPLQVSTKLPVHINGFFDIDSSRQNLTSDRTLLGNDAIRVRWNEALTKHSIPKAYTMLIEALIEDLGTDKPRSIYDYWPDVNKELPGSLEYLPISVYKHLGFNNVIRSAEEDNWGTIHDVFPLPKRSEWGGIREPLIIDKMPIPNPALPREILRGFEAAGVIYTPLTPEIVRDRLRIDHNIASHLSEVQRKCLRTRKRVVSLLRYCLRDDPGLDLVGLPLAILADGKLHTFGYFDSDNVFLATKREREIFSTHPSWFVDKQFAEESDLEQIPEANLIEMSPEHFVEKLGEFLSQEDFVEKFDEFLTPEDFGKYIDWDSTSASPPNVKWLTKVFSYFNANCEKLSKIQLDNIPLVPDQFDHIWEMGKSKTPLLPPPNIRKTLKNSLTKFGIPMVNGSMNFMSEVNDFVERVPDNIWKISTRDLVDTLDAFSSKWEDKYQKYVKSVHDPLIDYFAKSRIVEDLGEHEDRMRTLKTFLIFPTQDGDLVRLTDNNVYFADEYKPPAIAGSIKLLKTGKHGIWQDLFEVLGVDKLDRPTLVEKVLLPEYEKLDGRSQYRTLVWIRKNLSGIEDQLRNQDENEGAEFREKLSTTKLILCEDGELHSAIEIYNPENNIIKDVLGESALFPDRSFYKRGYKQWLHFFEDLGMENSPRPQDILRYVDGLIELAKEEGSTKVSKRLKKVFSHILEYWGEQFTKELILDKQGADTYEQSLIDSLNDRSWLPAQRSVTKLKKFPGYKIPEDKLYAAHEIIVPRQAHLIASQYPIADIYPEPKRIIGTELGFVDPDLQVVINHFDLLLDIWHQDEKNEKERHKLIISFQQIYDFFGKRSEAEELRNLREHYFNRSCLWDGHEKLWKPIHVFSDPVDFFGSRRISLNVKFPSGDAAYEALGRRQKPEVEDYVAFLAELKSEFGHLPLPESEHKFVIMVLRRLGELIIETGSNEEELELYVPTSDGILVRSYDVLVANAPWYEDKLESGKVHLLHKEVSSQLIEAVGINLLSECIGENIVEISGDYVDEKIIHQCSLWQNVLNSPEFLNGVLRLIKHDRGYTRTSDLSWLANVKVEAVNLIKTELTISQNGYRNVVGEATTDYYFDPDDFAIKVTSQEYRLMESFLAKAINQQLDDMHLIDLSPLVTIIGANPPGLISNLLDKLRIPSLEISEQDDAPEYESEEVEFPVSDFEEEEPDGDDTQTLEHVESEPKSHDEGEKSRDRPYRGKRKDGEIPPPTKPGPGKSPRESTLPGRQGGRRYTYVFRGEKKSPESSSKRESEAMDIGKEALKRVLEYEEKKKRNADPMHHSHPGYDVIAKTRDGKSTRYIEIKGIDGEWGEAGVSLSPTQFEYGSEKKEEFWLYVVEFARDPSQAKVHPIQNPIEMITDYNFDHGWKELIDESGIDQLKPEVGMTVRLVDKNQVGKIIEVDPSGEFYTLTIMLEDSTEIKSIFQPNSPNMELVQ